VFLARLAEAVAQQKQIVSRMQLEFDAERKRWQAAAQKANAVRHVVDGWKADERRAGARREQHESDERAQHSVNKQTNEH
jgi:flagellar export protein FliJ